MHANVKAPTQDGVYSAKTNIGAGSAIERVEHCSIRITAENTPLSLARIYGLLATLMIVPRKSRSVVVGDAVLEVEFVFRDVSFSTIDRFLRKLNQTTEIIAIAKSWPERGVSCEKEQALV